MCSKKKKENNFSFHIYFESVLDWLQKFIKLELSIYKKMSELMQLMQQLTYLKKIKYKKIIQINITFSLFFVLAMDRKARVYGLQINSNEKKKLF